MTTDNAKNKNEEASGVHFHAPVTMHNSQISPSYSPQYNFIENIQKDADYNELVRTVKELKNELNGVPNSELIENVNYLEGEVNELAKADTKDKQKEKGNKINSFVQKVKNIIDIGGFPLAIAEKSKGLYLLWENTIRPLLGL